MWLLLMSYAIVTTAETVVFLTAETGPVPWLLLRFWQLAVSVWPVAGYFPSPFDLFVHEKEIENENM